MKNRALIILLLSIIQIGCMEKGKGWHEDSDQDTNENYCEQNVSHTENPEEQSKLSLIQKQKIARELNNLESQIESARVGDAHGHKISKTDYDYLLNRIVSAKKLLSEQELDYNYWDVKIKSIKLSVERKLKASALVPVKKKRRFLNF